MNGTFDPAEDISLIHLVLAYRKAKVDLYYDGSPRRLDLIEYEEDLAENLQDLLELLEGDDENWVDAPDFLGTYTFLPKSLTEPTHTRRSFWSVPSLSWQGQWAGADTKPAAKFRLMAQCSIHLHVFSTLWMLHVGTSLDANLGLSARGNRLQRDSFNRPELLKPGSFESYQSAYSRWRDDGLKEMVRALDEGIDVVAMTADVTSFYHRLNPAFLLDERFLSGVLGVDLTDSQAKVHRLFIRSLTAWAELVEQDTGWEQCGLPVGLPASAVVANLALAELDRKIDELEPRYYGRYVDDILLVLEDEGDATDQETFLRSVVARLDGALTLEPNPTEQGHSDLRFEADYLEGSRIVFGNEKNKTFHLSASSGRAIVEAIRANIQARNSEFRALAVVPARPADIEPSIAEVRKADGDPAQTLRDADEVSARKQSFSIKLRDFESMERNLPPSSWGAERIAFFDATREHVLALPAFFELAGFLTRLVSLGAACSDSAVLTPVLTQVAGLPTVVDTTCTISVSNFATDERQRQSVLDKWATQLADQALEGLVRGWITPVSGEQIRAFRRALTPLNPTRRGVLARAGTFTEAHRKLAQRDLAHRPYRWSILGLSKGEKVGAVARQAVPIPRVLRDGLGLLASSLPEWRGRTKRDGTPSPATDAGLVFATRPPSMMELYRALAPHGADEYGVADSTVVRRILRALRGWTRHINVDLEHRQAKGLPDVIHIPIPEQGSPIRIALVMMETDETNTEKAANGNPNHDGLRYTAIRDLLETVRTNTGRPNYVLLPELSIPADWFDEFALGLTRSGVSLIAGTEHQTRPRNGLTNQVWAALRIDNRRKDYFPYRQDKQRPAEPERPILHKTGRTWDPQFKWKRPPVIEHGGFRFSLLICSELTNIDYRAHLRGSIDALLIPEWNQDLHSFEALVEASALDLHAYIAQSNTRGFGDTRLRAPGKDSWDRDVVRLQGGAHDYHVVGEIDYKKLRAFQHTTPPPPVKKPKKPATYKPLPDGFEPDPARTP